MRRPRALLLDEPFSALAFKIATDPFVGALTFFRVYSGTLAAGSVADVTIFDPKKRWTYDVTKTRSRSRNCPYDGWPLRGRPVATIVDGQVRFDITERA